MAPQNLQKRKKKKQIPSWQLVVIDVVAIGVSLCIFALFHHALPREVQVDLPSNGAINTSPNAGYSTSTPTLAPDATPTPAVTDSQGNLVDTSGWWSSFPDKFTSGEVIQTENSYQSKNVNITVTKVQENGVTYFVQDIYIRRIECFATAFAKDKYGQGITQTVLDMAVANNAICAMNGDYYGSLLTYNVVIRNGKFYMSNPDGDVCVLFYNGEMKTYSKSEFNADAVMEQGAYQAWCFGPALLKNGKAITETDSDVKRANPRSGIGYFEPGHYCFITVDGRQPGYSDGLSMLDYAKVFEELGCVEAYNLDGGQTAVMTFGDAVINKPTNGGRKSSDILLIQELEG